MHDRRNDGDEGYPKGLKGEKIPLGARIIAVADFFEAITSKRHYREPMPLDEAIDLIRLKRDRDFSGEIVDAFLRYCAKSHIFETLLSSLDENPFVAKARTRKQLAN